MSQNDGQFTSVAPPSEPVSSSPDRLPTHLNLLCIGPEEPSWIALSLHLDALGCHEPRLVWVSTGQEALSILRHESFDCILATTDSLRLRKQNRKQKPPYDLLHAIRAGGHHDPLIYLTRTADDTAWLDASHHHYELFISDQLWDSNALVAVITRSLQHVDMTREFHRLSVDHQRRLVRERDEAEQLLTRQREMIEELRSLFCECEDESATDEDRPKSIAKPQADVLPFNLPAEINDYYQELLRTYVIMGSGSLGEEIGKMAELLTVAGLSPRDALRLHLGRVESLVNGLGCRSTRHVMARADLLALELMIYMGEHFQTRWLNERPTDP